MIEHPPIAPATDSAIESHSPRAPSCLRQSLRAATSAAHERLHRHAGFARVQDGTIDLIDYRALLMRLFGFHLAFEAATGAARERSVWLEEDLATLGIDGAALTAVPLCTTLRGLATPARRLGALYVVEGSTLGGRQLAGRLDPLLGADGRAGRHFFLGRGSKTNVDWNLFMQRLLLFASTPFLHREIISAAVSTFDVFEQWMRGWRSSAA